MKKSIIYTLADQKIPGRGEEIAKEALAKNLPVVVERAETAAERALRLWQTDPNVKTIPRDDHRAIHNNLDAILRGDMRVV